MAVRIQLLAKAFSSTGDLIIYDAEDGGDFLPERGFPFNLYMIDLDGKNLTRISIPTVHFLIF